MKNKVEKIIEEMTVIGPRRYEALKSSLKNIDMDSVEDLVKFREINKISVSDAEKEIEKFEAKNSSRGVSTSAVEYFNKINEEKPKSTQKLNKKLLWHLFTLEYKEQNRVFYSSKDTSIQNIKPLIYYFIGDLENFKKCSNVSLLSVPSLDKGLLLIGDYGTGKTSVMKTFETVLRPTEQTFKNYSANEIVDMFEKCDNKFPSEKEAFKKKVNLGIRNFDDILTERIASNYGKANLFKEILEERYNKSKLTHVTINYKDEQDENGKPIYNLQTGLQQIGEKYGNRVYDRLFSMFNIIEFKGKSFRK